MSKNKLFSLINIFGCLSVGAACTLLILLWVKVLGASVGSLLRLLSSEFALLIVIAMLIATPVAWYAMENWLASYAYHTAIGLGVFALAWGISLLITFMIVVFQSAKISRVNPIKILRSE